MNTTYTSKRILITGATGFIGQHLLKQLANSKAEIAIITRLADSESKSYTVFSGNITDKNFISKVISEFSPNIIFHLAASKDRSLTSVAFDSAIEVNLKGTLNILFSALELKNLERIILLGTAEEYGNNPTPFIESMRESSASAYSFAKQSITHLSELMYKSFSLPTVVIRPSIVYGPGQQDDMFLPALIQNVLKGEEFIMSPGEQTRDYVYVDDVVSALLKAGLANGIEGEIINVGSGQPIKIVELAKMVEQIIKRPGVIKIGGIAYRKSEQMNYWVDTSKALKLLNWNCSTTLVNGLTSTIEWYKNSI